MPNCKGLVAYLPVNRLNAFCTGWRQACNCHCLNTARRTSIQARATQEDFLPNSLIKEPLLVLDGPENHSGVAKVQKLKEGQRRMEKYAGESPKTGVVMCRHGWYLTQLEPQNNVLVIKSNKERTDHSSCVSWWAGKWTRCWNMGMVGLCYSMTQMGQMRTRSLSARAWLWKSTSIHARCLGWHLTIQTAKMQRTWQCG